jgi:hypothetical protein
METVSRRGALHEAVRKNRQSGDRKPLTQVKTASLEERLRARKLQRKLFTE